MAPLTNQNIKKENTPKNAQKKVITLSRLILTPEPEVFHPLSCSFLFSAFETFSQHQGQNLAHFRICVPQDVQSIIKY